jgi:hypothetical protein
VTTIDEVIARDEIHQVLMRYCRGLDRMDRAMASTVWHDDATVDYRGYFTGTGEGFLDWVWPAHAGLDSHAHQITNVLIEVDGDTATSEAYVTVVLRGTSGGRSFTLANIGRYLDTWERRDGRWAIVRRVYVDDLKDLAGPTGLDGPAAGLGARDRSDPSYDALGW